MIHENSWLLNHVTPHEVSSRSDAETVRNMAEILEYPGQGVLCGRHFIMNVSRAFAFYVATPVDGPRTEDHFARTAELRGVFKHLSCREAARWFLAAWYDDREELMPGLGWTDGAGNVINP